MLRTLLKTLCNLHVPENTRNAKISNVLLSVTSILTSNVLLPFLGNLLGRIPVKVRPREDSLMHIAPRSLFDRPSPALIKMRQEMRHHRHRGTPRPITSLVKPVIPVKLPPEPDYVPDWTIQEDYTILQVS